MKLAAQDGSTFLPGCPGSAFKYLGEDTPHFKPGKTRYKLFTRNTRQTDRKTKRLKKAEKDGMLKTFHCLV